MDIFWAIVGLLAAFLVMSHERLGTWFVDKIYDKESYEDSVSPGKQVLVSMAFDPPDAPKPRRGAVVLKGSKWKAETMDSEHALSEGDYCEIVERRGVTLIVKPQSRTYVEGESQ